MPIVVFRSRKRSSIRHRRRYKSASSSAGYRTGSSVAVAEEFGPSPDTQGGRAPSEGFRTHSKRISANFRYIFCSLCCFGSRRGGVSNHENLGSAEIMVNQTSGFPLCRSGTVNDYFANFAAANHQLPDLEV